MCPTIHSYILAVVAVSAFQFLGVTSFSLTISPEHLDISVNHNSVAITCTTDVPLTGCQFTWLDLLAQSNQKSGPVLELSQGPQTQPNSSYLGSGFTGYSYSGRGLGAGDCGVTLELEGSKEWMVGCRVRAAQGSWRYAWVKLYAWVSNTIAVSVSTHEVVVLRGGEITLVCRSPEPLESCKIFLPGSERNLFIFDKGSKSPHSAGRYLYHGDGLENGECGIRLKNVTEFDNEPIQCYIWGSKRNEMRIIPVIVASPPSSPKLGVTHHGTVLKATCFVGPSRPVANITWLLDDEIVRRDAEDDSPADPEDTWRWPWVETSISQHLTYTLTPQDKGKRLRCVTSHKALPQPLEATTEIFSEY